MRQVCNSTYLIDRNTRISPKLKELESILSDLAGQDGRKIVIFSEWTIRRSIRRSVRRQNGQNRQGNRRGDHEIQTAGVLISVLFSTFFGMLPLQFTLKRSI